MFFCLYELGTFSSSFMLRPVFHNNMAPLWISDFDFLLETYYDPVPLLTIRFIRLSICLDSYSFANISNPF